MSTEKPRKSEDEYFVKRDAELIKTARTMEIAKIQEEARRQHLMKCPKDGYDLSARNLHGVQIEVCHHCGGFWLDQGELEVLIRHEEKGLLRRIFKDVSAALSTPKHKEPE